MEITDARGQVLRAFTVLPAGGAPAGGQEMRGPFRRGGGSSPGIKPEAGMQRLTWDLRFPGPWAPNAPERPRRTDGPPRQVHGETHRGRADHDPHARSEDRDPRVLADGVTDGDLSEQVKLQLSVRDAVSDARKLQVSIEEAMKKAGVKPVAPAMPGATTASTKYDHPLQQLWAQVATTPGIYTQGMLVDQLNNVQRMIGQADQKVGKDAYDRFSDLQQQLAKLQAEFAKMAK